MPLTTLQKAVQQNTLAAVKDEFNGVIVPTLNAAALVLRKNALDKYSNELLHAIEAYIDMVNAINAVSGGVAKALADTKALLPSDPGTVLPPIDQAPASKLFHDGDMWSFGALKVDERDIMRNGVSTGKTAAGIEVTDAGDIRITTKAGAQFTWNGGAWV